jgi:hypothetical protein
MKYGLRNAMHSLLSSLFCCHAAASFDRRCHIADLIGSSACHLNLAVGLLSSANAHRWHVQLLGTKSHETRTWLWAWANPSPGLNPQLLAAAHTMKGYGERRLIKELTTAQLPLGEINGHFLATVASGVCQANAYFRAPYDGGAAFLLIKDDNFPRCTDPPLARIATIFPQAISTLDIPNHKLALMGYLAYYGLKGQTEGNTVVVKDNGRYVLLATFDQYHRLKQLDVTIDGREPESVVSPSATS